MSPALSQLLSLLFLARFPCECCIKVNSTVLARGFLLIALPPTQHHLCFLALAGQFSLTAFVRRLLEEHHDPFTGA